MLRGQGRLRAGGGGVAMPGGALGIWYVDQYQSSPRPYVPNSLETAAVSANLFSAPRRCFKNPQFWTLTSGVSVTDANAPDLSAVANQLSTLTYSSGATWAVSPSSSTLTTLAAGTYTMGLTVRWKGTGSADFKLGPFSAPESKTATGTVARYSVTFVHGGGNFYPVFKSPDDVSDANFEFGDFECFSGSVDLGTGVPDTHLYMRKNPSDTSTSYADGALDFTGGARGLIQFPVAQSLTAGTCLFVWSRTGNGFNSAYDTILSENSGWNTFSIGPTLNNAVGPRINSTTYSLSQQNANLYDPVGGGWAVGVQAWNASGADQWINDVKLGSRSAAVASVSIRDLNVGFLQESFYCGSKIAAIALYDEKLSDAEIRQAVASLKARVARSGITADPQRFIVYCGDSITYGSNGSPGYVHRYAVAASPTFRGINLAVGGQTVAGATSSLASADAIIPADKGTRKFIFHGAWGANDLGTDNSATFLTALESMFTARKTAGFTHCVAGTILPRTSAGDGGVQFNIDRNAANTTIRTWEGGTLDAVADFAANATIGADASSNDTTYYAADKVHPIDAGHAIMATIEATAVDAV
jgi:hypothetical protein